MPTNPKYRRLAWVDVTGKVYRSSHHYSHEMTCGVEMDLRMGSRADRVEALVNEFQDDVEALRYALCKAIYRDLEAEYEYRTSDEALAEDADANEYTFDERGNRDD